MRVMGRRSLIVAVLVLILSTPLVGPSPSAQAAATFTVNSTTDEPDVTPGDGVCSSTPSGACTLRAAVMEANALSGGDTIVVPAGTYRLERIEPAPPGSPPFNGSREDTGAFGDLDLLDSVTINGAGPAATIVTLGGGLLSDRLFHVVPTSVTATITGPKVTGGNVPGGGGILNRGTLTLQNVDVSGNSSNIDGGGLLNTGTVTIIDSVFSNTAFGHNNVFGGSISNGGTLTATRVRITGGADDGRFPTLGGGLYNQGQATLTDAIVGGGANYGGGIANHASGTLTLRRVLVTGGRAYNTPDRFTGMGGGIYSYGTLDASNVTVSGNQSEGRGGGIENGGGTATLTNVTIGENTAGGVRPLPPP